MEGDAFIQAGRFSQASQAHAALEAISGALEQIAALGGMPAELTQMLAQTIKDFVKADQQPSAPLPAALQQLIRERVNRHRDLNALAQQIAQTASQQAGGTPIRWSIRLGPPNGVEMIFREEPHLERNSIDLGPGHAT